MCVMKVKVMGVDQGTGEASSGQEKDCKGVREEVWVDSRSGSG